VTKRCALGFPQGTSSTAIGSLRERIVLHYERGRL
jgi:hypothetical protein